MDAIAAAEANRRYFDERAAAWEAERTAYYSDAVRQYVVQAADFGQDEVVVDYGAGSGYLTKALLDTGVRRVVAVDISANMLSALSKRFGNTVEQRLASGDRMPFEDGEVDGVTSNMVLHHLEDPGKFFLEASRVLRPGGRVVVTDMLRYDAADFTREQNDRWPGFEVVTVERWIRAAGLDQVYARILEDRCCGSVPSAKGGAGIFIAVARRV